MLLFSGLYDRWYHKKKRKFAFLFFFLFRSMLVVETGVLFRAQTLLASNNGKRRRGPCENRKYVRIQTHRHTIALFFVLIHLSISFSNMYKNKFDRSHDYIINPKLVSVLFSLSHPLSSSCAECE